MMIDSPGARPKVRVWQPMATVAFLVAAGSIVVVAQIQRPRDAQAGQPEAGTGTSPSRRDVHNIIARRRGSGAPTKKALLLSAHYDSVARGPGAGDDASGVASILGSLRAPSAGPPLERDVIVHVVPRPSPG
jgi:Zn-dependent M28 family amino/carboxypeptidase